MQREAQITKGSLLRKRAESDVREGPQVRRSLRAVPRLIFISKLPSSTKAISVQKLLISLLF